MAGAPTWQPVQGSVLDANIVDERVDDNPHDQAMMEGEANQHPRY